MGNITMVDGHVPDGSYQNVTANGSCSCDAGMRFDGLRARGSFDAMGLDGGNVHCEGRLVCRGDMHVNRISGHGELHVGGDLRCSALDFTGKIIVQGDVMCPGGMTVRGLLRNRSCIVTRYLDMQGTLDADELRTERLRMTPPVKRHVRAQRHDGIHPDEQRRTNHRRRFACQQAHLHPDAGRLHTVD